MATDGNTSWRSIGNCPFADFERAISRSYLGGGPSAMGSRARAIYDALAPHKLARLGAAMAWHETKNFTWNCHTAPKGQPCIPLGKTNPWAVSGGWVDGKHEWVNYVSFADAAADWAHRLLDPDGPYAKTTTLRELLEVYAPAFENDLSNYIRVVGNEVDALPKAGEATASPADRFVAIAKAQVGKPYKHGAAGPDAFDCSGLVAYAYKQATGKDIARSSYEQFKLGTPLNGGLARPGDLIFWDTERNGTAGHVAVFVGDGKVVHAINEQRGVIASEQTADMGGPLLDVRRIFGAAITTPAPKPLTFGNVPYPAVENRIIQHNTAWDDLGVRLNRGVVLHRMIGTLRGTDSYFRGEAASRALTDYGVGTAGTDGAADDGKILVWNDPRGRRSPWASGPVSQPYGDGAAFVKRYGSAAVNRDLRSVEISGRSYDDPVSERAWAAVASIVAYWADQARVPWDVFPLHPETGISFVFFHQEFTIGTGKICPGRVVMDGTTALIERVRGILREAQTGDATTQPPPTEPLEIMQWPLSHVRKAFPDYDPNGPVSKEYKRHCLEMGALPRFVATWAAGPGWVKAWEFSDGWYVMQSRDGRIYGSDTV